MYWLVILLLCCVKGVVGLSLATASESILEVSVECGHNVTVNDPVISIITDVEISAAAKCKGGDQNFVSDDSVHFVLPAAFTTRESRCLFYQREGSEQYYVEVDVHYGEQGSLIMTKQKILTAICNFGDFGKDASPEHSIREGPIAPIEIQSIVGGTIPSSDLALNIQTVDDQNVVGPMALDRRYSIYGAYTGGSSNVGLKPVSCDAVSNSGDRYSVLRAGCGDGLIFDRTEGFKTLGTTFRSPYFVAFHLSSSTNLAFDCNVTLCSPSCDGSSCEIFCGTVTAFSISNAALSQCSGELYEDTCTFDCDNGYDQTGDGISSCGADGIWTTPTIACTPKDCGTPPNGTNSNVAYSATTFSSTATYTCNPGYTVSGGDSSLDCLASGSWETGPLECTIIQKTLAPCLMFGPVQDRYELTFSPTFVNSEQVCYEVCFDGMFKLTSFFDSDCWCGFSYLQSVPGDEPCTEIPQPIYQELNDPRPSFIEACVDTPTSGTSSTHLSSADLDPSMPTVRSTARCGAACYDNGDSFYGIQDGYKCMCSSNFMGIIGNSLDPKPFQSCIQPCNSISEPCLTSGALTVFLINRSFISSS